MHWDGFSGKAAIVTGSSEGIGFAIAKALVDNGANVLLVARREELLREAAERLGPNAAWISADLMEEDAAPAIVEKAIAAFGGLDFLVNSAGVNYLDQFGNADVAAKRHMMNLNLLAPSLMVEAAFPHLSTRAGAAILNVSTAGARKPTASESFYGATKAGLEYLTKTWAILLSSHGIRVNGIAPAAVETPQFNRLAANIEGAREMIAKLLLIQRMIEPEEIGDAALLLLSPVAGSFITGTIFEVDGGYHVT